MPKRAKEPKASPPLVILNPVSGAGAGHDLFRHCEHALLDLVGEFELRFTDQPGDAERLTRVGLQGGPRDVIVVGGDGTINEVVNGCLLGVPEATITETRLILLGGGTGSDLMRSLGLSTVDDTLRALQEDRSRALDIGLVRCQSPDGDGELERFFINIASFGLSSLANQEVSRFSAMGGAIAYAAATAWSLVSWRSPQVRLTYTSPEGALRAYEGGVVVGAFANGRYFGSGMMVAPEASLDDGLLDLVLVGDMRRRDILRFARLLYDGSHVEHPDVMSARATHVKVEGPASTMIEADGEVLGYLPAAFEVSAHKLRVVA